MILALEAPVDAEWVVVVNAGAVAADEDVEGVADGVDAVDEVVKNWDSVDNVEGVNLMPSSSLFADDDDAAAADDDDDEDDDDACVTNIWTPGGEVGVSVGGRSRKKPLRGLPITPFLPAATLFHLGVTAPLVDAIEAGAAILPLEMAGVATLLPATEA